MANQVKVTYIISCFNGGENICLTLDSLINQTIPVNIIVSNDGSIDSSSKILKYYSTRYPERITFLDHIDNKGLCYRLNQIIKLVQTPYIARIDIGDVALLSRTSIQLNSMETEDLVLCGSSIILIDKNGNKINTRHYPEDDSSIRKLIWKICPFAHPSIMMKTETLISVGGYCSDEVPAEDYGLYFRLLNAGQAKNIDECLTFYTVDNKSMTSLRLIDMANATFNIRKKYLKNFNLFLRLKIGLYSLIQFLIIKIIPLEFTRNLFEIMRPFVFKK